MITEERNNQNELCSTSHLKMGVQPSSEMECVLNIPQPEISKVTAM
jgi:hypothetical protein